jgi:DNA repair exonuclease SbcCD nuclease subunit
MKILRVGDPHIRPNNILEANQLMEFICNIVKSAKVDRLEILGDLFHTHAVVRLEVLEFWDKWLQRFSDIVETVVLVGNHDMGGDYHSHSHALTVFKRIKNEKLKIIDEPTTIGVFGYLPYVHDGAIFLEYARRLASQNAKVLVCHATFSGSQFDNGFYAPEGINPDDVPFDKIISGHIHKEQILAGGKVDYPGTAKWDTASDANERKGVWLYEHDVDGKVLNRDMISTEKVVTPIVSFKWIEGQEAPVIPEGAKASVELIGSSDWITKQKTKLKGKVSISSKFTDKKEKSERKSGNSLENFLANLYVPTMDRDSLMAFAKEIGIV